VIRFGLAVFLTIVVFGPAYADNTESSPPPYSATYCTPDSISRTVAAAIRGGFEDSEYAARRIGTTPQKLRAYVYAASQTASEMRLVLKNLSNLLRGSSANCMRMKSNESSPNREQIGVHASLMPTQLCARLQSRPRLVLVLASSSSSRYSSSAFVSTSIFSSSSGP
jgi:hypothetical protein